MPGSGVAAGREEREHGGCARSVGVGDDLARALGRTRLDADHPGQCRVQADGGGVDPEVVEQLLTRRPARSALSRLSPRELEVLALMAEGLGNTAIARSLVITDGAVHKHIRSIFAKLDLAPDDQADRRVVAVLRYLHDAAAR